MESHEEHTHHVKRVVLPSGKTIEVVYFKDVTQLQAPADARPAPEPDQALHLCVGCGSGLVHPVEWEESGEDGWSVLLHCPNCSLHRQGIFGQETVERFDEELDRGADALARDYTRLMRANMAEETERFAAALAADAILPEDF